MRVRSEDRSEAVHVTVLRSHARTQRISLMREVAIDLTVNGLVLERPHVFYNARHGDRAHS